MDNGERDSERDCNPPSLFLVITESVLLLSPPKRFMEGAGKQGTPSQLTGTT